MPNKFLVVCQARTGSSMLSSALQQHPEICAHGEVLNLRSDDRLEFFGLDYNNPGSILDYLRAELKRAPDVYIDRYVFYPGRFKAAGFKFKYEELSHPLFSTAREYVLRHRDIRIVHMTRDNTWKRFLSEYVALNITKVFNSADKAIEVPDTSFRMEPDLVREALDKTRKWQAQYRNLFSHHPMIEVTYEEFNTDPAGSFSRVTDFLEVSDFEFRPFTKQIQKSRSDEDMIENYEELRHAFRGTAYEHMFQT